LDWKRRYEREARGMDRLGSAKSERKSQARADNKVIVAQSEAADKNHGSRSGPRYE
jgi:hypothetical protein